MKRIFILVLTILLSLTGFSQVANYGYTSTTSTWSYNSSPTTIHTAGVVGGVSPATLPAATSIGFNFVYNGITYTQFKTSVNGFITFNTLNTLNQPTNNLKTSTERVIVAVLWDENRVGASGTVNYKRTGTTPNQIMTIEWKALRWDKNGQSAGLLDCQIKLYETTNVIEFIYYRGSNAYKFFNSTSSIGASIGLGGATSGDFLSLSDLKASTAPTKSTSVETTTIGKSPTDLTAMNYTDATTQIGNGTKYRFTPPAIALPIELLYFKGVPSENHNHITWSTASEHNNNYFEIETTIDGIEYHTINRMSGSGNSNTKIDYEFDDYNIGNDINYYKLKQTDYDGKFRYSDLISIDNRIRAKIVSRMVSLMGTEVNEMYRGMVIVEYTDGSIEKIIR